MNMNFYMNWTENTQLTLHQDQMALDSSHVQYIALAATVLLVVFALSRAARPLDAEDTTVSLFPGYPCLCCQQSAHLKTSDERRKVAIIGAGASGMAAAMELSGTNCDVTVFEARNRIGGRIHSDESVLGAGYHGSRKSNNSGIPAQFEGSVVEWGAHWIHGEETNGKVNPILELAKRWKLELEFTGGDSTYVGGEAVELASIHNPRLWLCDAVRARSFEVAARLWDIVVSEQTPLRERSEDMSFKTHMQRTLELPEFRDIVIRDRELMREFYSRTCASQAEADQVPADIIAWHLDVIFRGETGSDAQDLSVASAIDDSYMGEDHVFAHGYVEFIESMREEADAEVQLGEPVLGIKSTGMARSSLMKHAPSAPTGFERAEIRTAKRTLGDFSAVIVTIPLGVLRESGSHYVNMPDEASGIIDFDPPLSRSKIAAAKRVGVGCLEKILLVYRKAFWNMSQYTFALVSENVDGGVGLSNKPEGYEQQPLPICSILINMADWSGGEPALMGLAGGSHASMTNKWAKISDRDPENAELRKWATSASGIKTMFPNSPLPQRVIMSNWCGDPFSRGSFSFAQVGQSLRDFQRLAAPEFPLYFAGEHTMRLVGTVHGAYWSGIREAARLKADHARFGMADHHLQYVTRSDEDIKALREGQRLGTQQKVMALFAISVFAWLYVAVVHSRRTALRQQTSE